MRLIDADALLSFVDYGRLRNPHELAFSEHDVKTAIDNAPTVDAVERKRGRWIPIIKGERGYSAGDFRCSVYGDPCRCYHLTTFCPNCGAEMRKGEANEDI